jgi:hypothetical protein
VAIASVQQAPTSSALSRFDFRSPSLEIICDHLAEPRKHSILDLGTPLRANIEFFSSVPCTLYVEDLYESLIALPPAGDSEGPNPYERRVTQALAHSTDTRFDLIFGWDLFNYMHEDQIHALMKRLSGSCRSGTLLFIMISTAPVIPARPTKITVTHEGLVSYEPTSALGRTNPRYTPLALERMMPGFRLLHSFLLAESMQDYLFSFD